MIPQFTLLTPDWGPDNFQIYEDVDQGVSRFKGVDVVPSIDEGKALFLEIVRYWDPFKHILVFRAQLFIQAFLCESPQTEDRMDSKLTFALLAELGPMFAKHLEHLWMDIFYDGLHVTGQETRQ